MSLLMQKKALQHVQQCTRGGLLADCLITHLNIQNKSYILKQQCLSVYVGSAWKILPVTAHSP
jgi:hypothetical protein